MNYGLLNFKAQNGKPGIFWTNEQQKKPLKKETKKTVDYKTRKQPFEIRHHPKNYDRIEPEVDNILKPLPDDKPKEPEKPKKPAKNFIQKNRERLGKGKKGKEDKKDGTVTLTQEQLNAILASVGKVASGEEDKLKIHIDSEHNEVTIESPRRREASDDETEKHYRDRSEKENSHSKSRKERRKKEDDSIYALMGGDSNRSKKDRDRRTERDVSDERDHRHRRSRDDSRERHRRTERDHSEERSSHRDRKSRDDSRERNHSRERYKHSHDRDRNHDRERERHPSYDPDYDRKRKQEDSTERILKDLRQKAEDQLEKSRGNDRLRESKSKDSDIRDLKKYDSTTHLSPDPNIENVSPREIAGIPVSLPWKHMTVAERRRLMIAREKVLAEAEKRKEEGVKSKWREMVKEETEKLETRKKKESRRRSPSYSPPRSRDGSGDRRRDDSRDRRERSRERRRDRLSPSDRRESRSRERRRRSPSDDRREYHSRERRNSRERSRDDSSDRSRHRSRRRSPSPVNRQEDKTSSTSIATNASTRPPTNMSLAEKKRLQWEKERAESQVGYTPWGKPGAGAPLRTKSGKLAADYRARQEDYPDTIDEESETVNQNSSQNASENKSRRQRKESEKREEIQKNQQPTVSTSSRNVPAAMRSSFIFGQIAPDADMYETTKERERQQWLKDLERQREEKREQQIKDYEGTQQGKNTWADKFSNDYRPARLPEQLPETVTREDVDAAADTNRISSAPVNVSQTINDSEDKSYIRGQNVYMDPITKKELEDSRQRQLEHQRAVMEQVQEKQRQKQLERERKMAEDAEEERKLQAERDRLQRQFEMEQNKLKMREVKRQEEVERLKAAMDEAHEKAMREKYSRKMQHLEQGGHDTSQLKAHLADAPTNRQGYETLRNAQSLAKITPRGDPNHVVPTQVPGLDLELSPRAIGPPTAQYTQKDSYHEPHYVENRVLTPNKYRQHGHTSEFGTQTGMNAHYQMDTDRDEDTPLESRRTLETKREATDVGIMYKLVNGKRVRVKSAPKEELQKNREQREIPKKKAEKKKDKKLWNYQNKNLKKPIKQSEKDPLYQKKKEESRVRRQQREQRLLEMVEKNRDIIPTERQNRTPGHSREHSPFSEGGRTPRSTVKEYSAYTVRRTRSHSPDRSDSRTATRTLERTDSPPNRKSPVSHHSISPVPAGRRSPPIPALRNRNTDRNSNYLAIDYDASGMGTRVVNSKYNDGDPLEIPVGNSDFVPFLRTVDILDPAKASSPMPLSREATQVANARKAYIKGMKPGNYGNRVDTYQDRMRLPNERRQKDPILNPSLVTDHPTQRQDAILQQLSTMRENLMQRQRELETFSPTDLE
ncbi:zinc finger CCCH domain-containing protein 13-like isoform X3 [Saccostrea echinata]|uniref:zinc finger CCCH domain-containing protein 13-like isoform X3 n=1 Tax=Saccostrea echinata TaxID=191078 RepID=UPI002A806792|nr:zinc finger CCCH domain-containing protein 13-like isoform X3 [Saccostrea echinata]